MFFGISALFSDAIALSPSTIASFLNTGAIFDVGVSFLSAVALFLDTNILSLSIDAPSSGASILSSSTSALSLCVLLFACILPLAIFALLSTLFTPFYILQSAFI